MTTNNPSQYNVTIDSHNTIYNTLSHYLDDGCTTPANKSSTNSQPPALNRKSNASRRRDENQIPRCARTLAFSDDDE